MHRSWQDVRWITDKSAPEMLSVTDEEGNTSIYYPKWFPPSLTLGNKIDIMKRFKSMKEEFIEEKDENIPHSHLNFFEAPRF